MKTEAGRWPLHARAWRRGHRGPQASGPAGPGGAAAGQGYPEAVGQGVGKPKRQAKGLTSDALAAVKATARIQRVHKDKRQRKETGAQPLCVP